MRVSDLVMNKSYLTSISSNKSRLETLSKQIANQSSILKPSDSPTGTAKVIRFERELTANSTYQNNIDSSLGFVNETINAMEYMESEISNIRVVLSNANNATNESNLSSYADQLMQSLENILTSANTSYDGKFVFGGTSFTSKPFSITSDGLAVKQNVADLSGESIVKIGKNSSQKINIPGAELFGTTLKQSGAFSSSEAVGGPPTVSTTTVNDSYGNTYDVDLQYVKTAANEYELTYNVTDSGGAPVKSGTTTLQFSPTSGNIISVDGKNKKSIPISSSSNNLNFSLDFSNLEIQSTPSALSVSSNQDQDIFNSIMQMKDNLENGILPSDEEVARIENFHQRLLDKLSESGNIYNNLENTKSLLETQSVEIQSMISAEKDLDIAQAVIEMQNYDYLLQASYKMSSMILPKSLLDFI